MRSCRRCLLLLLCLMLPLMAGCGEVGTPTPAAFELTPTIPSPMVHTLEATVESTAAVPEVAAEVLEPLPESVEELAQKVYGERLIEWVDLPDIHVRAPVRAVGWDAGSVEELPEWDNPGAEVGWVVSSGLPGDESNILLYGHNNIHSSVFKRLAELQAGDLVTLETGALEWRYRVREVVIIAVSGKEQNLDRYQKVLQAGTEASLTLLSCWPPDNNTHRVIVTAFPESKQ